MSDKFMVKSHHPGCGNRKKPPTFDAVLGCDKSFLNIRICPDNYNRKLTFVDKKHIESETFSIADIKRIINGLRHLVKLSGK